MARIDDGLAHNLYGWRLARSAEVPAVSPDVDVVVVEAAEVAHGYRHLTIVHGDPRTVAESRALDRFYETLRALAAELGWVRVRGDAEFVTVTTRGETATDQLRVFEIAAALADPGSWSIAWSAVPVRR